MVPRKVLHAFHNKIPITLTKNVDKLRSRLLFNGQPGAGSAARFAEVMLRIVTVELNAKVPFARVDGVSGKYKIESLHPKDDKGTKFSLRELMIPCQAIKQVRKFDVPRHRVVRRKKHATAKLDDIAVWWISQSDCENIGTALKNRLPAYIHKEYASRLGRPGRLRLWVANEFGDLNSIPESPKFKDMDQDAGGIVIWRKHVDLLKKCLPYGRKGLVTDANLEPL